MTGGSHISPPHPEKLFLRPFRCQTWCCWWFLGSTIGQLNRHSIFEPWLSSRPPAAAWRIGFQLGDWTCRIHFPMKAPSGLGLISIFLIGFSKVSFGVNNGFLAQNFCLVGLLVESDLRFNRAPLPIGESASQFCLIGDIHVSWSGVLSISYGHGPYSDCCPKCCTRYEQI